MLTTKNYKLKKPELTDSPPDITVMNPNWDTVDEKLFAVIQAWENFKKNGGAIDGILETPVVNTSQIQIHDKISDDSYYLFQENNSIYLGKRHLGEWAENAYGINFESMYFNRNLIPSYSGKTIGTNGNPWADVFITGFSRSGNGYTRINNKFIVQWGIDGTAQESMKITFPVSFPNECFVVSLTPYTSNHSYSSCSVSVATKNDFTYTKQYPTLQVRYIAIGW